MHVENGTAEDSEEQEEEPAAAEEPEPEEPQSEDRTEDNNNDDDDTATEDIANGGLAPATISEAKPAYVINYTARYSDTETVKVMEVLTIDGDEVYSIDFAALESEFDYYLPTVYWMLSSEALMFFDLEPLVTGKYVIESPGSAPAAPPDRIITPDCGVVTDGSQCYQ